MPPFGSPFCSQNRCQNPTGVKDSSKTPQEAPKRLPRRPREAPGPPKTRPRRSPDSPGQPQDPPRRLPDLPRTPPDALPDFPDDPKWFSEASGPITCFKKFEKFEIVESCRKRVEKKSTTVIHDGHSHRSLTKTESTFTTVGTQRVAAVVARSALQSAAPSAARRVVSPS